MNFYTKFGVSGERLVFILSATQLVNNNFREVISSILNKGKIPKIFSQEEIDQIYNRIVAYAKQIEKNYS